MEIMRIQNLQLCKNNITSPASCMQWPGMSLRTATCKTFYGRLCLIFPWLCGIQRTPLGWHWLLIVSHVITWCDKFYCFVFLCPCFSLHWWNELWNSSLNSVRITLVTCFKSEQEWILYIDAIGEITCCWKNLLSNTIATSVENKGTGDWKLNDSPGDAWNCALYCGTCTEICILHCEKLHHCSPTNQPGIISRTTTCPTTVPGTKPSNIHLEYKGLVPFTPLRSSSGLSGILSPPINNKCNHKINIYINEASLHVIWPQKRLFIIV